MTTRKAASRRSPTVANPGTILVATDFSPASEPALEQAIALARRAKAELLVLHVMSDALPFILEPDLRRDIHRTQRHEAQARLEALVTRIKRRGVRATPVLRDGEPRDVILAVAKRRAVGLVVLGTHGHTGMRRMLVGSVAREVVNYATMPVLTVRGTPARDLD